MGYIDYQHLEINFKDVAVSVIRQIKAFSFREYQMPRYNGISIISAKITNEKSTYKPGTVIFEDESKMEVATIDYNVILYKDRFDELLAACKKGDLEIIESICSVEQHINAQDIHGWTPLIVATYNNHYDAVRFLVDAGADIHINNYHGTNLIMYAKEAYKKFKDRRLFDLFKDMGIDINDKDEYGLSVIDYIQKEGLQELL